MNKKTDDLKLNNDSRSRACCESEDKVFLIIFCRLAKFNHYSCSILRFFCFKTINGNSTVVSFNYSPTKKLTKHVLRVHIKPELSKSTKKYD